MQTSHFPTDRPELPPSAFVYTSSLPGERTRHGNSCRRFEARLTNAAPKSRLYRRRDLRAGPGNRGEYRDLFGDRYGVAEAAGISSARPHRGADEQLSARFVSRGVGSQVQQLAQAYPGSGRRERVRSGRAGTQSQRRRPSRTASGHPRFLRIFRSLRRPGSARPHIYEGRRQASRRQSRGAVRWVVEAAVRFESRDRGQRHFAWRRTLHGHWRIEPQLYFRSAGRPLSAFPSRPEQHQPGPLFPRGGTPETGREFEFRQGRPQSGWGRIQAHVSRLDRAQAKLHRGTDAAAFGAQCPHRSVRADRRGGLRAVDCVRQRRQPAAGPRDRAFARDCHPRRYGCRARAHHTAATDRECAAIRCRRCHRPGHRNVRRAGAIGGKPRRHSPHRQRWRSGDARLDGASRLRNFTLVAGDRDPVCAWFRRSKPRMPI